MPLFFWLDLFLEARAEFLKEISLVFWSKQWHQRVLLKLTDLYYDPQSTGINLQSPQSDSTPWTLTLAYFILKFKKNLAFCYDFEFAASRNLETVLYERNLSWRSDLVRPVFGLFTFTNWIRRYQIILQVFPQSVTRFLILIHFMWFEIQNSKTFTKMSNLLTHCLQNVVEFRERKKERHFVTWYAKFFQLANNAVVWSPTPEFKTLTIIFTWEGFRFAWQHFKILCTSNKKNKIR